MNSSKAAIVVNKIIQKLEAIFGWVWTVFMTIALLGNTFREDYSFTSIDAIMYPICFLIGIACILDAFRRKKLVKIFKKYISQLSVDATGSLKNIAAATGTSVDEVKKNLTKMIDKRFFINAYINEAENRLVLPSVSANTSNAPQMEYILCNCPNCGGANRIIKGTVAACDFCGSPLKGV